LELASPKDELEYSSAAGEAGGVDHGSYQKSFKRVMPDLKVASAK